MYRTLYRLAVIACVLTSMLMAGLKSLFQILTPSY